MALIKPIQQNQDIVNDISSYQSETNFKVWWLGQSGFLIKYQDSTLLFDPYLSDSLPQKYANTDKPHTRMSEIVVDPSLLTNINIVTTSHNHTDHLDAETLNPILANNANITFIGPEANREFIAERLKINQNFMVGLTAGQVHVAEPFTILGLPAAHNLLDTNEIGQNKYMSFIVKFGPYTIYHSGDTLWYDKLTDLLQVMPVDLAFLPINGNKPERKVAGNLTATEAAQLGKAANIKCVIPHHYDMFEFNTEDPQNFVNACKAINQNYKLMQLGEGWEYKL